ncbi:hypothetical protein WG954_18575 [Lacibacter sp. H375]|uniref:hypothetical protein n=1 Tax=Lacibacter sp. H375 TaxID=3133424 RepID=UPI0030C33BD8
MKKIILLLFTVTTLTIYGQPTTPVKNLYTVNSVTPKKGQKMAFEAAYKTHVAKFHKVDKTTVYEIITGPNAGSYHIVSGAKAYEDFDTERSDKTAHSVDLDKNFFPYLEETTNATYRFIDSCSWNADVVAESFSVAVDHLKQGINQGDYRREVARNYKIQKQMANPMMMNFSWSYFEQLWDGSDQVVVSIRNLKDGFKALEPGFYGRPTPPAAGTLTFRDRYTKEYGYDAWDARVKTFEGAVIKTEVYLMKLRKDLSSQ